VAELSDQDIYLFREGSLFRAHENLGGHLGSEGARFAVWAPNARRVAVVGDFNDWQPDRHPLQARWDSSGIWEGRCAEARHGHRYQFHIESQQGETLWKADPYAIYCEMPPGRASVLWDLDYTWGDDEWMRNRRARNDAHAPMSIYEVHAGSWRRMGHEQNRSLGYRELAHALADHVVDLGFTHVELMPIMEHPFYGSWGYQITGYFAPTSRYGTPQDFMYLVDHLHQRGIGVILDWVPSHFPTDAHGLAHFDGSALYEHQDPRQGFHPEWRSAIFNYGRAEVRNFLGSNALFWLERYHIDGLRIDAVASMLYLDYARQPGEWIPNQYGGHENLEAVSFLQQLNTAVYRDHPDTQTIAEESTAWPQVSRPVYLGGLGFGMKWNMGWMHDTLEYVKSDPVYRKYLHDKMTFSLLYAFTENFVLPLSHDEVVYGKGSLLQKQAGDDWQQRAGLRVLYAWMWCHPGKKLLFMGGEFGQRLEWNHDAQLQWDLLEQPGHAGLARWLKDLNALYRATPALYERDFTPDGFAWIDCRDRDASIFAFERRGANPAASVIVVLNFTPVPRENYRIGVPRPGHWVERLNSDATLYGGSGQGNLGGVDSVPLPAHGHYHSITLQLPPLGALVLTHGGDASA